MMKSKIPKLKPSARDKRRYFLTTAKSEEIKKAILEYVGVKGLAKSVYMEVKNAKIKNYTVGSCLVDSLDDVRASLAFARINIVKVSGTIKGLGK